MMLWVLCWLIGLQGCSLIDDDLSVCGTDFEMVLRLELETSLDLELQTTLSAETDTYTRQVLYDYFSHIFTDHAHDIHIGFYSQTNDGLVHSISEVIDASQSTYTFYLPKDDYHAIALANLDGNGVVSLADSANSRMANLVTLGRDTLPTQGTGIFAVSRDVTVIDTADQKIDLTLHMASSAVALVLDTTGVAFTSIRAIMCNTADGLYLRDGLYTFGKPKTVRMERIEASPQPSPEREGENRANVEEEQAKPLMFGCASFPSPDEPDGYGTYYQSKVYVGMPDGKTTETELSVREPLEAGQLKIIRLQLQPDGSVKPTQNSEVGATVTLDWKDGGTQEIII